MGKVVFGRDAIVLEIGPEILDYLRCVRCAESARFLSSCVASSSATVIDVRLFAGQISP